MSFDNTTPTPPPAPGQGPHLVTAPASAAAPPTVTAPVGEKSFLTTWILALLMGVIGVDRFYLGKVGTGILKLVTFGGLGIWALIDLILVLTGATRDAKGLALTGYQDHRKVAWIVTGVVIIIGIVSGGAGATQRPSTPSAEEPAVTAPSAPADDDTATVADEPEEEVVVEEPEQPAVPAEYASALTKATQYSDLMHMSKAGIYDQLTSEYGEKFTAEAGQYAVDTIQADWNANALAKAKSYQETMSMSPEAIRDQLTSEYGEKFTAEEADYAIAHLND